MTRDPAAPLHVEVREGTIRQHCPCGSHEARQTLTYAGGRLTADRSVCAACGSVLWDWTWSSMMAAAREARAAIAAAGGDRARKEGETAVRTAGPQLALW